MSRRGRRFAWAAVAATALVLPFTTQFHEAALFAEAYYLAALSLWTIPPDMDYYSFFNGGYDRVDVLRYYDRKPQFEVRLATGSAAGEGEWPETSLVRIDSSILIAEAWWIGEDRLKLAFVVDPRAKIGPTVGRVGRFRIDYTFIRGYEPSLWPFLLIKHRP